MSKALFIADFIQSDRAGGGQTVAAELARRLRDQGDAVDFLVAAPGTGLPEDEERDGIRILRYYTGGGPLAAKRHSRALADRWGKEGGQLVHTHFAFSEWGPAQSLAHLPWVRTFHGPWDEEGWFQETGGKGGAWPVARLKRRIRRWFETASLHRANRVIVLSECARLQALALGTPLDKLRLIPGGSDLQRFFPKGSREDARLRLGLPAEGPLLVTVRRLVPRMGLEPLITAMGEVLAVHPGARLVIGGRGPEQANLETQIDRLGFAGRVILAGFIPDEALADYYRAADLFVLPTTALEGFGLVTVDALACGTPVLGTPVGATSEILGPLDGRLLTAGTTPEHLAGGILRFFTMEGKEGLSAARLHEYVKAHYTWDRHAEGVQRVYQEILSPWSGRPAEPGSF